MAIEFTQDDWQRIRETYAAWWAGELDRPLINVSVRGRDPGRPKPKLAIRGYIPQYGLDVPAEDIVDCRDYELSCRSYPGDAFPHFWPNFGAGVMGAYLGARLEPADETVWFHAPDGREIADIHFAYDADNVWFRRTKEITAAAMERWQGAVQVAMTDLGGNLDILSTFRPGQQLLLDLYDHPDEVKRLTWEAHELWFRYFDEFNAILQPANPGHTAWAAIFSAEPYYMLQCDFCYMISPEMFDEFVKPELAAACKRLVNPFYHLDGPGQLPHLDSLLAIEELKGVQWIPGAGAPDMAHWPQVYRKIRDAGKLIQVFVDNAAAGPGLIDTLTEQLGSAKGIILIGEVGPERQGDLADLLARHGAV